MPQHPSPVQLRAPATQDEIEAAALQFVRKVTGFTRPSHVNAAAFDRAVADVSETVGRLLAALSTSAPARNRAVEAAKARARSLERQA